MAKEGKILVVDDKASVLNSLELFLKYHFEQVLTSNNPNRIPGILEKEHIDVVLLDMNFAAGVSTGNEGLYWLRKAHKIDPQIAVVLFTAYGSVDLAVAGIKEGATDFVMKPWDNNKLLATLKSALKLKLSKDKLRYVKAREKQMSEDANKAFQNFIGKSSAIKQIMTTIEKVAKTDASILITGENGTGKELVAREIHRQSGRNTGVLMNVDVGSLTESLFESELFGHVKGAFTDARESRIGRFEAANGGTLFLDEICNLALPLQAKLLTALEQREITPVGSNRKIPVDIRLITATNKDLNQMVNQELFRDDLLYRLNTIQIELPPLRNRKEDIILLAEHFLEKFKSKYEKLSLKLNKSAIDKLQDYYWPGNIRELMHTMEKAVILSDKDILTPGSFTLSPTTNVRFEKNIPMSLEEGEKLIIQSALEKYHWNISEAARELKIGRQTLYRKIERYDL